MPNFVPVVYSGGGPVIASDGVTQRVACAHLAEWLQVYDALQVYRGRGHVTYFQIMGGADASAGTHLCGSAWDMKYVGDASVMDAREMGAAVWPRLVKYGWTTGEHVHGVIGCGDNNCNYYQITAYWNGYNGLGLNGVLGPDPLPKPSAKRTWQEGIAWAKAQMNPQPEDEMTFKTINVSTTGAPPAQQVLVEWGSLFGPCEGDTYAAVKRIATAPEGDLINARERDLATAWRNTVTGVNAILAASEDPAAIAAQIAASLPTEIAKQVADELVKRLAS